jgi:Holliday junction resolvasome RuvABC DNA-binding subunit
VQAALLQLGYSPSEVEQALAALPPDAASDLETALRSSLRLLSEPMRGRAQ